MVEFNATFLIAILSFVVFIMIMNAIFYNPILNIIRKREEYIASNYDHAKNCIDKAQEFDSKRENALKETQAECRANIRNTIEEANVIANEKTHNAREESKVELQTKKESLAQDEKTLEDTLKNSIVKDLSQVIVSKLLGKQ
ncbi:hypothetical protein HDR58_08265 [bacterium]|nr:hypothetical protein [bacterium]